MTEPTRFRGIFHAVVTRDGEGMARDGQPYLERRKVAERGRAAGGCLYEIRFADGQWMLAREEDLKVQPLRRS